MHDGEPRSPMKSVITGSGIGIPKNVVPNDALARIMDTSDEWIRTRSGIQQRYFADPGQGSAELGMAAAQNAMQSAGRTHDEIDAVIFAASENGERGFVISKLFTNGSNIEALYVPGVGFRLRPYVTQEQVDRGDPIPVMDGREVFKQAVSKMPESVREVCAAAGITVDAIDVLLIHQANLRIVESVGKALGLPPEKVPHNIERYGNTTAGTLPILFHECVADGRIKPGMLICFTALGSGLHWGAALYRT